MKHLKYLPPHHSYWWTTPFLDVFQLSGGRIISCSIEGCARRTCLNLFLPNPIRSLPFSVAGFFFPHAVGPLSPKFVFKIPLLTSASRTPLSLTPKIVLRRPFDYCPLPLPFVLPTPPCLFSSIPVPIRGTLLLPPSPFSLVAGRPKLITSPSLLFFVGPQAFEVFMPLANPIPTPTKSFWCV